MKEEEFRTGNLIYRAIAWNGETSEPLMFTDAPYQIDSIDTNYLGIHDYPDFSGCMDIPIKDAGPIMLTEEWLIKFGFNKAENFDAKKWKASKMYYLDKFIVFFEKHVSLNVDKDHSFTHRTFSFRNGHGIIRIINDVHQLQNLYFALTGTELKIK